MCDLFPVGKGALFVVSSVCGCHQGALGLQRILLVLSHPYIVTVKSSKHYILKCLQLAEVCWQSSREISQPDM